MRNRQQWRSFFSGVAVTALVFSLGVPALAATVRTLEATYSGIRITLDGREVDPKDANGAAVEPFAVDGTTYLPVRAVADALGCLPEELVFTSCGTEGDNWAIRGAVEYGRRKGKHIITTAIEHSAVLEPLRELEGQGYDVTYLRPDRSGHIDIAGLEAALRPDTVLVSMMLVNNELGTILPVREAAQAIRRAGSPALLHTDAVQGFLKVP